MVTTYSLHMDDGTPDPDRRIPAIRASDPEREATSRLLQQAYSEGRLTLAEFDDRTTRAYAAVFQSDLAELTRDLSPARQPFERRPEPQQESGPARRVTGGPGPSTSLAVLGGCERNGPWTVTTEHTTVAVMGGVSLDLRRANLQSQEVTIRAFAFMGGIEIVVPDDVQVDVSGLGIMGGFGDVSGRSRDGRPVRQAPSGAPRIRVTGLAVWAGVEVRRVPREQDG